MELDQKIFQFVYNQWSKFKQKKDPPYTVYFESLKDTIQLWVRVTTGYEIEIAVNGLNPYGGCCGFLFYYPEKISFFSEKDLNVQFYLFKTLYMSEILKNNLFLKENINFKKNTELSLQFFPFVLKNVFLEYPESQKIWKSISSILSDQDLLYVSGLLYPKTMIHIKANSPTIDNHPLERNIQTEIHRSLNVDNIELIEENKEKIQEYTLMHNFEKIETIEEFLGNWRNLDGEDELKEHEEALKEIKHQFMIRSTEKVHSIYKTEFSLNGYLGEVSDQILNDDYFIYYDEWDQKKRKYNKNYVKVYPKFFKEMSENFYLKTINKYKNDIHKLKKIINNFYNKITIINKQFDGIDVDYDSYVDYFCDLSSKRTPDERIYQNKRLKNTNYSIVLLLDQSLSTDGYVENHRIIDLEKEALIVLGDVLKDIPIYISIAGFYSITRNQIYFNLIKDFKEPWDNALKKIGAIQPQGYTRIGAAIRHANYLLNQFSYAQKWIILLSDGKPNDYDKYEGKYGIYDIQQAIREGRKNQIHFFGIALEKEAKYYLPLMFGQNHYKILDHPNHLFETLTTLILKISHQT
jgi:nitric oxide reductase NorD protein